MFDKLALVITIIGSINWGLVGLFRFDLISFICGGSDNILARILYVMVAAAAIWCISLLFKENALAEERANRPV